MPIDPITAIKLATVAANVIGKKEGQKETKPIPEERRLQIPTKNISRDLGFFGHMDPSTAGGPVKIAGSSTKDI